jgi:hypothetical protein
MTARQRAFLSAVEARWILMMRASDGGGAAWREPPWEDAPGLIAWRAAVALGAVRRWRGGSWGRGTRWRALAAPPMPDPSTWPNVARRALRAELLRAGADRAAVAAATGYTRRHLLTLDAEDSCAPTT